MLIASSFYVDSVWLSLHQGSFNSPAMQIKKILTCCSMLRTLAHMFVYCAHVKAFLIPDNTPNVTAQDSSQSTFPKAHPSFLAMPSYSTLNKLCLACTCAHVHACVFRPQTCTDPNHQYNHPLSHSHRSYVTTPKFAAQGTRIWMITCSMLLDKLNWWLRFLTCRGTLRQSHMCTHTPSHTHAQI